MVGPDVLRTFNVFTLPSGGWYRVCPKAYRVSLSVSLWREEYEQRSA